MILSSCSIFSRKMQESSFFIPLSLCDTSFKAISSIKSYASSSVFLLILSPAEASNIILEWVRKPPRKASKYEVLSNPWTGVFLNKPLNLSHACPRVSSISCLNEEISSFPWLIFGIVKNLVTNCCATASQVLKVPSGKECNQSFAFPPREKGNKLSLTLSSDTPLS